MMQTMQISNFLILPIRSFSLQISDHDAVSHQPQSQHVVDKKDMRQSVRIWFGSVPFENSEIAAETSNAKGSGEREMTSSKTQMSKTFL